MISLNSIYHLILIHLISNVYSQSSPRDIIGTSACETYGIQKTVCQLPDAPIESFPKGCSSYFYYGINVINNTLNDTRENYYSTKGYLDKLIETNKSVLIFYGHQTVKDWCVAIQPNNTASRDTEINDLKKYLDQYKGIKGIVFANLMLQGDPPSTCPDYNQNLKCYLDLMKTTFTNQIIGISIPASEETEKYQNPELPWLDLHVLDPAVDFYTLALYGINTCSDEFLQSGQYPLTGNFNYTVDKMRTLVEEAGAKSSKIYYRFAVFAEYKGPKVYSCLSFVSNYCKNSKDSKTSICGDTVQTLFDKGAYVKQYGAGFIFGYIDTDDFDCTCQCGQSYPGFNAMLSGYNGGPPPPPCTSFDRT